MENENEISEILEYAEWLHQKDVLAPTVMYNYRTWGSTRMADRTVDVVLDERNDIQKIKELTLLVLGLIRGHEPSTYDRLRSEMQYEIFESLSDEISCETDIKVPQRDLAIRVANEATFEFAEFFEQLRDSLRNVLIDIEQRETREKLLNSDDFFIQHRRPVGNKRDHCCHAHQEGERVFNHGDSGVDFYRPATKFFFAEAAAATAIADPYHHQAIHRRNDSNGNNHQPDRSPKGNLCHPSYNDQT